MNNQVLSTLKNKCKVQKGEKIIVALSGGADSVTLLDVLLEISKGGFPLEIFAAHVNHNLRGEESQRDEDFVKDLCQKRGVTLFTESVDVARLSGERGESIELCARNVRYDFFFELSAKLGARIATAHTLSDCQETMLYNIARGTTLHGLTSIPYTREDVIRPLLDVTRAQVEAYCKERDLSFVTDSTNMDESVCKRNKIRHSVLPPLKDLNEGFDRNFGRLREDLLLADDFLRESARKAVDQCATAFGFSAEKISKLHPALRRRTIALIAEDAGAEFENQHILLCEKLLNSFGAVMLLRGFTAVCTQGVFRVVKSADTVDFADTAFEPDMCFLHNGKVYTTALVHNKNNVYKKFASLCIDCAKINSDTVIRKRREGDTFSPLHRGITKPLRKLQSELRIPKEIRGDSLVVASGSVVLWAEHIGVSAQGAMGKDSEQGIYINIDEEGTKNA